MAKIDFYTIPNTAKADIFKEISSANRNRLPFIKRTFFSTQFGSLVDEQYPNSDFALPLITVPAVNPERTFLEKSIRSESS